jgi:hypothetical protein
MPEDKQGGFWTSMPGILTGLAALVAAAGGIVVAVMNRSSRPTTPPPALREDFAKRLDDLYNRSDSCPKNSWKAYVIDFTDLGDLTTEYINYVAENPRGDRSGQTIQKLLDTLDQVQGRTAPGVHYFEWQNSTGLHDITLPKRFHDILKSIQTDNGTISTREKQVLDKMVQDWYRDAGITHSERIFCEAFQNR